MTGEELTLWHHFGQVFLIVNSSETDKGTTWQCFADDVHAGLTRWARVSFDLLAAASRLSSYFQLAGEELETCRWIALETQDERLVASRRPLAAK